MLSVFERLGIAYYITGSMASIRYGEPRLTNDIDIIADLQESQVNALCRAFPQPDFYVSEEAALDAVRTQFQFNILHSSGLKADVILPADTDYARTTATRIRRLADETNFQAWFIAPEDVIRNKLLFYQMGGSDKHLRDITGVLRTTETLDRNYLTTWADRLDVKEIWDVVCRHERDSS
jgi:hypothetical protein